MQWPISLIFPLAAFFLSMIGTRLLIDYLTARKVLDHPNARSSHQVPTPRGAGIAVVGVLLTVWIVIGVFEGPRGVSVLSISAIGMILAGVSLLDDLRSLGPAVRLTVHAAAVAMALILVPFPGPIFGGVFSPTLDLIIAGASWLQHCTRG